MNNPRFKTEDCRFKCMECDKEFEVQSFNFGDLAMVKQLTCPECQSGYIKLLNPELNKLITTGGDEKMKKVKVLTLTILLLLGMVNVSNTRDNRTERYQPNLTGQDIHLKLQWVQWLDNRRCIEKYIDEDNMRAVYVAYNCSVAVE